MEQIILDLIEAIINNADNLSSKEILANSLRKHNKHLIDRNAEIYKRDLYPYYKDIKENHIDKWNSWNVAPEIEPKLLQIIQMKPRRTASGVATITVMTKPWGCSSECIYCPNDVRMPKSYLADEPVCQRAERAFFDPYLQIIARLTALNEMGHNTDKIELIILGGTWTDYSANYQIWYVKRLFEALNDFGKANNIDLKSNDESTKQPTIKKYNPYISADETPTEDLQIVQEDDADTENLHLNNFSEDNLNNKILDIKNFYISTRLSNSRETLAQQCKPYQDEIQKGTLKYNNAIKQLYILNPTWKQISSIQKGTISELEQLQKINETSKHRVVGLVIETRPDTINSESLTLIRQLGCTKIQIGVQSLYQEILDKNHRYITIKKIEETFSLLRIFGFKIHAHFMVNLLGSNPEMDKLDYANFVQNPAFMPDEVKIYPCSLVDGTPLMDHYNSGEWQAYNEDDLVDVLVHDTEVTPRFCRISRMIRDISAHDIVAGNKKGNLRQIVENKITQKHDQINEIRYREINDEDFAREDLRLNEFEYDTYAAKEIFLEWITPDDKIAGFLRLSLPKKEIIQTLNSENNFPIKFDEAMIREIHVYGKVAKIHKSGVNSQHLGLGKNLVKRAKEIARTTGYKKLNVISSVGTREYYRKLGFVDGDLYQQALL